MSDQKPARFMSEIFMGFEIVPNQAMKPGSMLLVPNKEDLSINDLFIVVLDSNGENKLEPFKPIPKEIDREEYWMSLIMRMVQTARQNKTEEYRELRKEIKRNMLEDKEAREFFRIAFSSVRI